MILYTAWVIERRRIPAMSTLISHKARRVVGRYEKEASRVLPL